MDADDIDDSILTTPQVGKMNTPFGAILQGSPGNGWVGQSPAVSSLMNFQRARLRHGKSRKSSSSGSGNSMVSPISKSPPNIRSIEGMNNSYLGKEMQSEGLHSRRESISWAANQLHISGSESDDGTLKSTLENVDGMPVTPSREGQRGVIRRVVTRRGNMLVRIMMLPKFISMLTFASLKPKVSPVSEPPSQKKVPLLKPKFAEKLKSSARPVKAMWTSN